MIRRLSLSAILLLVSAFGPAHATDGIDHGLLWKVEHTDIDGPSYLFGTMHSADERVNDLPDHVEAAFSEAERYRFEIDFSRMLEGEGLMQMFYRDGRTLENQIPDDLWERTRKAAETAGIPAANLNMMKPWAVAMILSMPQEDPTRMLDYRLFERARDSGRPVEGLESIAEQIGVFDELGQDQQIEILRQAVDLFESGLIAPMYEQMIALYLEQDLAGLVAMAEDHPTLASPDDEAAFMQRLVDDRNRIMVTRMESGLREGGAFVAVGALHLPGEQGIVRLLEGKGYRVSVVE